jgi:TatD DNase family protein
MIFETHAHYDDEAFDNDRKELLATLPGEGIEYVVDVSASAASIDKVLELAEAYSYIYATVGIHPGDSMYLDEDLFSQIREKARHPKVVAIGEIGLDYYWDTPDRETQKLWFARQLKLARELKLPVVIHSRDAANDTFQIMKEAKAEEVGGIIHCFGYGVEQARQYLNKGYYLGIGGVVTFTNGRKLKEVVAYAPIEQLVLETDCPYLAPVPHRGKRNSSLYLTYVAKEIGRIKNLPVEEVIRITNENAKKIYFPGR